MTSQKAWLKQATHMLESSLLPIPHELNELDWKSTLSDNTSRLAQHCTAFANLTGGGFFVFGISTSGAVTGITSSQGHQICQRLGSIARDALDPPQQLDHAMQEMMGHTLLFVHVRESPQKPVHLRGKSMEHSYIRSGGQTRKMSTLEIANAVLASRQVRFEELTARSCTADEVLRVLDVERVLALLKIPQPADTAGMIEQLVNHKLLHRSNGSFSVTNLGVLTAARDLTQFPGHERHPVRVVTYRGPSRIEAEGEREFLAGYGVGFQDCVRYVMQRLPTSEVIRDALRQDVPLYPEITIRELLANALIHQDFTATGANPMIEMFSDRLEISNPGTLVSSITVERLIDASPVSRNELLASSMRRMGICEERGSGIDRALFAVELFGLPPVKFVNGPHVFRAVLYRPKPFKRMTAEERLNACLQHCCLRHYVANDPMTNPSLRKRLGLRDSQYAAAWRVIDHALTARLIKRRDASSRSRKYASYIPHWA